MTFQNDIPSIADERGTLIFAESTRQIPFDIKRIYFVKNTSSDSPRGFHAHKTLRQAAICVQGSFKILLDDGQNRVWLESSRPDQITLIEPLVWHELHEISRDCIFVVLASDFYNENDYIRDYGEFVSYLTSHV
jgi:dTDP-4-dehydrorhamnose 3,5-epimerase-like enzyme